LKILYITNANQQLSKKIKGKEEFMSKIIDLLGSRYPIIQGAMGVICNPELVAAVSEAGGFGLLATTFAKDIEVLRSQVRATKSLTDKPFGANLFVMNPLVEKFAKVLAEEGVKTVTVSGGAPKTLIPMLHNLGMKAMVVVPTVEIAKGAEALGADAVIAEGAESGGVQGFRGVSTLVLVPAVADSVKIPVIAAGGIADSRGYRAALALGAEGIQMGTRFIASKECIAHPTYKQLLVEALETGTGLVNMTRFRIRVLRTLVVEKILKGEEPINIAFTGEFMEEGWIKGNIENSILPSGEVAGIINRVLPVREIIEEMVR
jgi:NAD(P)H-dependent flavin oxidoreductase YrpB (nitropropane dioxygenase family)